VGIGFLVIGLGLTLKFIWDAAQLYFSHSNDAAMRLFHYSCLYTLAIFGVIAIERLVQLLS
jgi:heme O synthase-like polyprenyltransferase